MRALTIRLCDPKTTDISQESDVYISNVHRKEREEQSRVAAESAATVSLGWLVKYGLNQPCAEATGICVSCLLGIVDIAAPSTLQPVLAELIGSLLMAMSGLEPAALNYLQVRAAGNDANSEGTSYDQLERLRINFAMSGPIAQALHKCLEMVQFIDLEAQKKLIPELDSSLRKGAGFATRAATADAVNSLCGKCPAAFSFPGSTMSNPTVRLLRAIYFASERERGVTAKDKITHAFGSLATLAPGPAVRALALKACERYCESTGSNNDPSIRKAAAATIRAIAVRASNHLADGGPKDIWIRKVLPVAFLGKHDKDTKVASLWKDVWDEGGIAINSEHDGVFGTTTQEKLLPYIARAAVISLQSTSWANRKAGCAVLIDLAEASILAPTPRSIDDHLSSSGPEIDRLRQRARASSTLLSECVRVIARNRIWDGKGDVVKAATLIAGKWTAVTSIEGSYQSLFWPLLLRKDCHDDLFKGDGWFKRAEKSKEDVKDDVGGDDNIDTVVMSDALSTEEDTPLDLKEDNAASYDEQSCFGNFEIKSRNSTQQVIFSGFCRVLLDQALRVTANNITEGALQYRVSALSGLTMLLKSVEIRNDSMFFQDDVQHQRYLYSFVGPSLFSFLSESQTSNAPVLIARALECLAAAMYDGIGTDANKGAYADPVELLKFFAVFTTEQPAWTGTFARLQNNAYRSSHLVVIASNHLSMTIYLLRSETDVGASRIKLSCYHAIGNVEKD
jgi:proteasome component ECM29